MLDSIKLKTNSHIEGSELEYNLVKFDDAQYHIQIIVKGSYYKKLQILISLHLFSNTKSCQQTRRTNRGQDTEYGDIALL